MRKLSLAVERFPIAGTFTISRGSKTEAVVVEATISEDAVSGRGEGVPYAHYGETVESVMAQIESVRDFIEKGGDRFALRATMPPGAARNALDCALIDLEAKATQRGVAHLLGLPPLEPVNTAFTISLDSVDAMAEAARSASDRPTLKVKLGGDGGRERLVAIRRAAPRSRIIVDANEGWTPEMFPEMMEACIELGVAMIEQPLPAGADDYLDEAKRPVPVCADESAHTTADIKRLVGRYDAVNVKLDKTGGLTEALDMIAAAEEEGLIVMVGCMVSSSLAMAPAFVAAQRAQYADIDGPLLLARDRVPGLMFSGSIVHPPYPDLWG
ncbi:N-acetyl-D-Glu racemase DgcA [Pleomorphomonas sp. NRK KF1]|uniref:N-acetyl-D-Glu racemase DgcA n=1 Tax=Pleomorphomonas sp. NRK KF1 TaxID=2943000 RepID=UPI002044B97B|nr:N-acetyl-D-Glu racemase DgcA [Pleomorphomonas sp. NRK KF1]MCM5555610.1 dipeptide epimerase [Pleomorphomonas sp. NRK KF1]